MKLVKVGDCIKNERQLRGWTQSELARRVPVGQQTISHWEKGSTLPDENYIERLLEVFELGREQFEVWFNMSSCDNNTKESLPVRARPLSPDLPIDSLTPEDFERFCRSLVKALYPTAEVYRFGSQGDKQDGIDLCAQESDGSITTYQCKRYSSKTRFGPTQVRNTIASTTIRARHHYILLTRLASSKTREVLLCNTTWSLWDREDIADTIRGKLDKDAQLKLVDQFFPNHREAFLGIPEAGPWLTAEEFFVAFDDPHKLFNHTCALVGRQKDLDKLRNFIFASDANRLCLIVAPGGSGKSRLLRAAVEAVNDHPEIRIRCLQRGNPLAVGLVDQLPEDHSILIIDDAHETPALEGLFFALATKRPKLRIIATGRPYGVNSIRSFALRSNLVDEPLQLDLKELTLDDSTLLATEVLNAEGFIGPVNDVAYRIGALTHDCPLATVIGARLVGRGQIQPHEVASDKRFRERLLYSFNEVLTGKLCEPSERQVLELILQSFALLQPLPSEDPDLETMLQLVVSQPPREFKYFIKRLEDAGVLVRRSGLLRLVPDVLADILVEKACFDESTGMPTGYVDKVFDKLAGRTWQNLLINVGKLDWQLANTASANSRPRLLDRVWRQVNSHFARATNALPRSAFLATIAEVAYYQPEQALELARRAVDDIGTGDDTDQSDTDDQAAEILPALVSTLRNVAYNYQCVGDACELLWELAKRYHEPLDRRLGEGPLRALQDIAGFGLGKPLTFHDVILEQAIGWLSETPLEDGPSPFDVLDVFLATEGMKDEFDEQRVIMRPFVIMAPVVRPLRKRVIDQAFLALENSPLPVSVRAIRTLEGSLRFPVGISGLKPTDERRTQWDPDHLEVLNRLAGLVASTSLEPLLYIEIRHLVRWHATNGHGETQEAAQKVLAILPDELQSRVTRCLIEGWTWTFDDVTNDHEAAEQHHQRYQSETADKLLREKADANETVVYLTERLQVIYSATKGTRRAVEPRPFVACLVQRNPDVGRQIIEAVLTDLASPLLGTLGVALSQLAGSTDQAQVVDYSRQLLALGDIRIDWEVAYAFSYGLGTRTNFHAKEIELIESLTKHTDSSVRTLIVHAANKLAVTNRSRAVRLLMNIDFHDSDSVAESVLGEFCGREFSLDDLNYSDRAHLLKQLEVCPSLNKYLIGHFLGALAAIQPEQVVSMLQTRIDHQREQSSSQIEGIPFSWSYDGQSPVILRDNPKLDRVLIQLLNWLSGSDARQVYERANLTRAVIGDFDDRTVSIAKAWLQLHPDKESVEAVSLFLSVADRPLVWEQPAFVGYILEIAQSFGSDCHQIVASNLFKSAITSSKGNVLGKPVDGEHDLLSNSRKIAAKLPVRSPARGFYRDLVKYAEEEIQWSARFDNNRDE